MPAQSGVTMVEEELHPRQRNGSNTAVPSQEAIEHLLSFLSKDCPGGGYTYSVDDLRGFLDSNTASILHLVGEEGTSHRLEINIDTVSDNCIRGISSSSSIIAKDRSGGFVNPKRCGASFLVALAMSQPWKMQQIIENPRGGSIALAATRQLSAWKVKHSYRRMTR